MATEIERKFMVNRNAFLELTSLYAVLDCDVHNIIQGYILSKDATVRIRHVSYNDRRKPEAFLTIKSKSKGISRKEYEFSIPVDDALEMLNNVCSTFTKKTRYIYEDKDTGLTWEIDFFKDKNEGLVIAEVELEFEHQEIIKPKDGFILKDVSDNKKLTNLALSIHPFSEWTEDEKQTI